MDGNCSGFGELRRLIFGTGRLLYHKRKRSNPAWDGDGREDLAEAERLALRKFGDPERTGDTAEPTDAQHISCFLVPLVSLLR